MTTRSITIAVGGPTAAGSIQVLATPPAGWCWILKTVSVLNTGGTSINIQLGLNRPGTALMWLVNQSLASNVTTTAQTWHIVQSGDQIIYNFSATSAYWWISGTVLPNPPS